MFKQSISLCPRTPWISVSLLSWVTWFGDALRIATSAGPHEIGMFPSKGSDYRIWWKFPREWISATPSF